MSRSEAFSLGLLLTTSILLVVVSFAYRHSQNQLTDARSALVEQAEQHQRDLAALDATYADLMVQVACLRERLDWNAGYIPLLDLKRIEDVKIHCYMEERP